jgi:hypothetical protein
MTLFDKLLASWGSQAATHRDAAAEIADDSDEDKTMDLREAQAYETCVSDLQIALMATPDLQSALRDLIDFLEDVFITPPWPELERARAVLRKSEGPLTVGVEGGLGDGDPIIAAAVS